MHNPSSQTLVTALERLACADGVNDVARSVGDWPDLGLVGALAIWLRDPENDRLQLLRARGVPDSVKSFRPGPQSAGSVLWRTLIRAEPLVLDLARVPLGLAASLKEAAMPEWTAIPLRGTDGEPIAIAVAGRQPWHPAHAPWDTVGCALERAMRFDTARWRSQWLDAIVPQMSDGLIIADADGAFYTYSPSLQQLVGWTEDEVRKCGWTSLVYPDPTTQEDVHRAIAALTLGKPSGGMVRTLATSNGQAVHAEIRSALIPHPYGKAPAMLGVFRDVTTARNAAKEATRDDALTRLGRMAGGVAHEFNNLLSAIMGHAELIEQAPGDLKSVRKRAQRVVTAARRGADLSTQLLAFSGATVSRIAPVAPVKLVDELIELFRPALPPHLALSITGEHGLAAIEADPPQLQQAITNLLANARDAAKHRVDVTIGQAPLPAVTTFRALEAPAPHTVMCHVQVRDDGPGFSNEAMANLFEPFWTGKANGHGLGLAAVRGIVGLHGGALHVSNTDGAQIDLYLPFSTRPELALPRLTGTPAKGRGRIWMIDDERSVLEFSRISLQAAGYDVRTFHEGAAAIEAAHDVPVSELPEVFVLDVVMPHMSGPQLVENLRALGLTGALLWTSGHMPASTRVPSDGAFLQKPFTGNELAQALQSLLQSTVES